MAFVGNARSIVPTRSLNFGGACAKQFAKLELLVPTNNSTLHRIISDHRRTCVQLRHCPTQLPCASWSARGESFPQSGLDLQDTNDDGRRILSARVRHGLPLAMLTQLRNGSSTSPSATAIRCVLHNCDARLARRKVVNNFPNNIKKQSPNLCRPSSVQMHSRPAISNQMSAGGAILTIKKGIQVVSPTALVLLHQLDGSVNTHAGRTTGESLKYLH